jgi:glycosyltransferase involved in cell wall biosynthesis
MGRNAAGESFLRGYITHTKAENFWVQAQSSEHANHFADTVSNFGRKEVVRAIDKNSLGALSQTNALYFPGPSIGDLAFQRNAFGNGAWSICGITHTTSSAGAMDALANLLVAPVQTWDAVICTSDAVKKNTEKILHAQIEYLQSRLGITRVTLPQLPVIPLGIHTKDFIFTENQKIDAREALGIHCDSIVVLYVGRLSFHAKAHPLAMYQALELAAKKVKKQIVLVECGWHANEHISKAYAEAADLACQSIKVINLDGREALSRNMAWAAADIFCSLSDNIQETFGIVPIEAMAAGLPLVVSDWDGYKDTVRDGIDGFRVPTVMPQEGLALDLAMRHALELDSYDMYCGYTCSLVAVDVLATAIAFEKLCIDKELRRKMGDAGRARAQMHYDWKTIITQYEDLWENLSKIRLTNAKEIMPLTHPWPARMDPFHSFAHYPTMTLHPHTLLDLVDKDPVIAIKRTKAYLKLAMVDFAKLVIPTEGELQAVIYSLPTERPKEAIDWVKDISEARKPYVFRSLGWLLKLGILKVVN